MALGSFYQLGEKTAELLKKKTGIEATLINPRFITGYDKKLLESLRKKHRLTVTLEDGLLVGGFGSKIAQYYGTSEMRVMNCGFPINIPNRYVPQEWMSENRLTPELLVEDIEAVLKEMRKEYSVKEKTSV